MKRIMKCGLAAVLALGILVPFASAADKMEMDTNCCQMKMAVAPNNQMTEAVKSPGVCPVLTGEKASSEYSYQYQGKTYYFCCQECEDMFKENPEQYLSRIKEFKVSAKKYEFNPAEIRVKQNDIVKITLTSEDATHGFMIKEYGIKVSVKKGEIQKIEFLADKKGTFAFRCSVFCGLGHFKMQGKLIVE